MKLNNEDHSEFLCTVRLTKEQFPIAFEQKVQEMISCCPDLSREEIESLIPEMEIDLELYYQPGYGLFAIENEAIGCGPIFSPYDASVLEEE